jgi:hypothetical protein
MAIKECEFQHPTQQSQKIYIRRPPEQPDKMS